MPGGFPVQTADGIKWLGNIIRWLVGDSGRPRRERPHGARFEATRVWTAGKWENDDPRTVGVFMLVE